ncbi:putative transposable element, partial [Trichonephila clavipes]
VLCGAGTPNRRDNEWGRVLFTDESRFSLSSDSHLERAGKPQPSLEHHWKVDGGAERLFSGRFGVAEFLFTLDTHCKCHHVDRVRSSRRTARREQTPGSSRTLPPVQRSGMLSTGAARRIGRAMPASTHYMDCSALIPPAWQADAVNPPCPGSLGFVEWAQNEIAVVPDFHKRILFSDEAHIWLNGYVNKQNCRIWSEANPQVYVETPLHSEKLIVWCALWAGGIIGPYFFKTDEGHNVTINGDRYRAMITNFFIPELNNHDVQELWFQQDGATCHTARATIDLLKDTFRDRLISRFGPVN